MIQIHKLKILVTLILCERPKATTDELCLVDNSVVDRNFGTRGESGFARNPYTAHTLCPKSDV